MPLGVPARALLVITLALTLAGCAQPTPPAEAAFDPSFADTFRPPAPPAPTCVAEVWAASGSGFEGIEIRATERTPAESVENARTGIRGAQAYLAACLGGDVDAADRTPLTIAIRSSAHGDDRLDVPWEATWGRDAPDTGLIVADADGRDGYPNAGWTFHADQQKTFAHEYAHIWHQLVGCGGPNPPVPRWFSEGLAEYVAYEQAIAAGNISREDARTFLWRAAFFGGQLDAPLSMVEGSPAHVGYFAIEDLVQDAKNDPRILRKFCEDTRLGGSPRAAEDAFLTAFGTTRTLFEIIFDERYGAPEDRPRAPN